MKRQTRENELKPDSKTKTPKLEVVILDTDSDEIALAKVVTCIKDCDAYPVMKLFYECEELLQKLIVKEIVRHGKCSYWLEYFYTMIKYKKYAVYPVGIETIAKKAQHPLKTNRFSAAVWRGLSLSTGDASMNRDWVTAICARDGPFFLENEADNDQRDIYHYFTDLLSGISEGPHTSIDEVSFMGWEMAVDEFFESWFGDDQDQERYLFSLEGFIDAFSKFGSTLVELGLMEEETETDEEKQKHKNIAYGAEYMFNVVFNKALNSQYWLPVDSDTEYTDKSDNTESYHHADLSYSTEELITKAIDLNAHHKSIFKLIDLVKERTYKGFLEFDTHETIEEYTIDYFFESLLEFSWFDKSKKANLVWNLLERKEFSDFFAVENKTNICNMCKDYIEGFIRDLFSHVKDSREESPEANRVADILAHMLNWLDCEEVKQAVKEGIKNVCKNRKDKHMFIVE